MGRAPRDERTGQRPGRIAQAKGRGFSRPWGLLVIVNALPIMFAIVVGTLYWKGTIKFVPGSGKVVPSLVVLGVTLAVLVVISWLIAPALFPLVRSAREFIDRNVSLIKRGNPAAVPVRLVLIAVGVVAYGVLWANLVVLALLGVVDVAAILAALAVFVREVLKAKG